MKAIKLIIVFALMFFLIGNVSAWEFDNVKSYDKVTREVTFKNSFIGIPTSEIAKATLLTPHNVKVAPGYQKVAEIKIEGFTDYSDILKQMKFYDMKKGKSEISRTFDIRRKTKQEVKVDDYETQCSIDEKSTNKTEICEQIKVGYHYETREVWGKLTPADIKKNEVLILGIFTNVQKGDYVDWVPTFFGVDVSEWATWTESLETDLISYYKLDETSGTNAEDSHGSNNGTANDARVFTSEVAGITNTGADFTQGDDYVDINDEGLVRGLSQVSFSIWINLDSYDGSSGNQIIYHEDISTSSNTNRLYLSFGDENVKLSGRFGDGSSHTTWIDYDASSHVSQGSWHYYTFVLDGDNGKAYLYIDGTERVDNDISTGSFTDADATEGAQIGRRMIGSYHIDGKLDEVGIWSRALSSSEVSDLYNNGDGLTPQDEENQAPNIDLNSPSDNAEYTTSPVSIDFNCYASDDINLTEVKLLIDGSIDQTNASGINNTNYSFSKSLTDGEYTWTCSGFDNSSQETTPTARSFIIDSTEPTLTLHGPTDNKTISTLPTNITLNVTSSDTHLDTCWYSTNENSTNTTYTCNSTTNISFSNEGEYTITYCANDTLGNENCNSVSNTIFYYTYNQAQSQDSIGEGDSVTFTLYVNMTNTPETNAVFNINNTNYSSVSKYEFTNYTYFSKTITILDGWGNSTGNIIDWYWTFNISGVTEENTTTENITIYEVAIDDCGSYGTRILNYTLYDEETKSNSLPTPLGNQLIEVDVLIESYDDSSLTWNYSKKETGTNTMDICIPNGLLNNTNYVLGVVTRFKADDHVVEFHYIDNFNLSIDNIPQDISLYDLYTGTERSEYSTSFLVNYQDEYYLPVQDAILDLLRYYVDEGEYISVENAKTDVVGGARLHLVTEDVRYYAIVRVDGEVVYTSPTFLALCQATPCQINFQKQNDVTPTNQTTIDNLNYQVTLDQDTRIVEMTYSSNDGSSVNVEMNVTEWDNYENNTICTDSATSSGGTLSCSVPLTATNSTYIVSIAKNGQSLPTYTFDLKPSAYDTFGYTGVFLTGLLYLTLVLMAVSSGPIAVVVFGLLGIIFAGMLNIFSGGSIIGVGASLMWLIIAGVIIIIKASSRRSGG